MYKIIVNGTEEALVNIPLVADLSRRPKKWNKGIFEIGGDTAGCRFVNTLAYTGDQQLFLV